ncbi:MAG: NAD(P)/FAD-dependent oxidoreductase [Acidobacteriota bacterium]
MRIGRSYRQHGIDGRFDAIVIGSGIGGLAAAALLARHAGRRVLVLERHYTAGGFTHTFARPGYEWDVGVHYVGQTRPGTLLRRAFDAITDGSLEWAEMGEVYDRIVIGDDTYDLVAGRRNFRERMCAYFPDETRAIDRYLELVAGVVRASRLYFAEKAVPAPVAALAGPLMRRGMLRLGRRTTREVLGELTRDERLIGVLTGQYGDYGLPPSRSSFFMHALLVNHYMDGGAYPVGGSSRISASIVPVIEAAGGQVVTSAEVGSILVERGRAAGVRLADGVEVRAPLVVSDAGVFTTFGRLLPGDVARRLGLDRRLARLERSIAHASLYVGLNRSAKDLGLGKANLWVYPHHDHDENVARFVADPEAPLPVAYLSFPGAKDPDFERRFPGRTTVEVITLAPWEWFERWQGTRWGRRGEAYDAFKARLAARLQAELLRRCPQVEGALDHVELSTPLSTRQFTGHERGEIYGLAHTPARFEQAWLRPRTPVRGLYLTGADVCTAGVAGALFGGVLAASAILGRNLLKVIAARRTAA